jgi:hypothetical protein
MIRLRPLGDPKSVLVSPPPMTEPGDRVKCKPKCCKSGKRCKRCPVVWKKLSRQGFAEPDGRLRYVVIDVVPKKALKSARARA